MQAVTIFIATLVLSLLTSYGEPSYQSSTSNVGGTKTYFDYEFTATNDGYAFLMDFDFNAIQFTSNLYLQKATNKYQASKWAIIGDSLSDPNVNTTVKKYYSYVEDETGLTIQNLAQNGCGYKRKYNNGNNFVEQSLLVDVDTDIVTIFGSFNDGQEFTSLGTVNDTTTDTVFGCVYTTLNNLITNNQNAKIGIILPTPWTGVNPTNIMGSYLQYINGIKTIANKFSVPVLELFYTSNMYPWNDSFKSSYYVNNDGVHPNSAGNKRFYPQVLEFIKTLI